MKNRFIFCNTFKYQIELLPRLTIIYGKGKILPIEEEDDDNEYVIEENGLAIEWLWFGLYIKIN